MDNYPMRTIHPDISSRRIRRMIDTSCRNIGSPAISRTLESIPMKLYYRSCSYRNKSSNCTRMGLAQRYKNGSIVAVHDKNTRAYKMFRYISAQGFLQSLNVYKQLNRKLTTRGGYR